MRAVQLTILVICLQIGLGFVATSGLFPGVFYEPNVVGALNLGNPSATDITSQTLASVNALNIIFKIATWTWIADLFQPLMNADITGATSALVWFGIGGLNVLTIYLVGIVIIQFVRNLVAQPV